MEMSTSIATLADALAKAQIQKKPATFDATNPHFKSKYATLTSIMEACRPALASNGIAIIQVHPSRKAGSLSPPRWPTIPVNGSVTACPSSSTRRLLSGSDRL